MTIEFEGSLNRLLNPTDPDRGCNFKLEVRDGGPIYLDIELEVSSSRLSIGFSVTNYGKGRRSTRILSSDGRFNVGRSTFELNVINPCEYLLAHYLLLITVRYVSAKYTKRMPTSLQTITS